MITDADKSGKSLYSLNGASGTWADRKASQTQLFQVIGVEGDDLTYKAYAANGVLYDAFNLHKTRKA